MKQIDARGMSCPQPVLLTKQALEKSAEEVTVLVDSKTAKTNVERFLNLSGYQVSTLAVEDDELTFQITARK